MICLALSATAGALYAYLTGPLLALVLGVGSRGMGAFSPLLPVAVREDASLPWVAGLLLVLAAIKGGAHLGQAVLLDGTAERVAHALRFRLYRHLLQRPLQMHQRQPQGELLARLLDDVRRVQEATVGALVGLLRDGLSALALLVVAIAVAPRLALMALVILPLVGLLIAALSRRVRRAAARVQGEVGALGALAAEGLAALREVKSCGAESRELERFGDHSARAARWASRRILARATAPLINEVLAASALAVTLVYAGGLIHAQEMAAERVVSFFAAILLLYRPIKGMGNAVQTMAAGRASVARVAEVLADPLEQPDVGPELAPLRDALEMRGVTYRYPDGRLALEGIDLRIEAGRMVVIAGASGAGKSTLGNLLAGLERPASGRMLWDGIDLATIPLPALRRQVALVPQSPLLFDGTIAANLRFGAPSADDTRLRQVLGRVGLAQWLSGLSAGLATPLGPAGRALSAGQAQRVAIARALLREVRLLVLDEPSSALDADNEWQLVRTLRALSRQCAVVVLSHSGALIAAADLVVHLDQGRQQPGSPSHRHSWPVERPESQSALDGA